MRRLAFLAPLAFAAGLAAPALAQEPRVTVTVGGDLIEEVEELGQRDVDLQLERLQTVVTRELDAHGVLGDAQVNLVLTDLKPNRPTFQQAADRPGLSVIDSLSIGGATIEGEVVMADGRRLPVHYARYSTSLADVRGFGTWQDADRAFNRLAANLASGRLVVR
ncbi:hypothetical protein [Brevundimonas aurifodinae]|uniref:Uncharacterized protein n=2 Tax=Brevundimonas TaxID=41275 RepID=A0ABV1NS57_9CAUL|nr:MAG: hypothetical protein B7Z42_12735 [Brevundimonas sp. 12-68-7]OYX33964.1 MAG: hypothetical protein B7Z01_07330 [Brevundimonas subvibrioides]